MSLPPEIAEYYDRGEEPERLTRGPEGQLEFLRTQALLERLLPAPPAAIADVGGGAGIHAAALAGRGYEVHLVDLVQSHVAQAAGLGLASALLGDARELPFEDERFDAVLLLGPLYHLPDRADRVAALAEARRVVRPGGLVAAAAISRYASTIDGLRGYLDHEGFEAVMEQDLLDGRHANPERRPRWFTTAYFHLPEEIPAELADAGLTSLEVRAIEGPAWMLGGLGAQLDDPERRARLLRALERVEAAPSLLGASAHLLAAGRR
jgi:ubiquinone/menaquinone biosynthesis C-methylase UbiE